MIGFVLNILIGAAILGGVIAVLQESEFPGWTEMVICVLAALVPSFLLGFVLPGSLALLAPIAGAICAAVAISATCGMTVGRSALAAGLWLATVIAINFGLSLMMS